MRGTQQADTFSSTNSVKWNIEDADSMKSTVIHDEFVNFFVTFFVGSS